MRKAETTVCARLGEMLATLERRHCASASCWVRTHRVEGWFHQGEEVDGQCREKHDHRNRRRYFLLLCAFVCVDARERDTEGVALVGRSGGFYQI
jgi:hypothetical protein